MFNIKYRIKGMAKELTDCGGPYHDRTTAEMHCADISGYQDIEYAIV